MMLGEDALDVDSLALQAAMLHVKREANHAQHVRVRALKTASQEHCTSSQWIGNQLCDISYPPLGVHRDTVL
jgi:hypothetical protein